MSQGGCGKSFPAQIPATHITCVISYIEEYDTLCTEIGGWK